MPHVTSGRSIAIRMINSDIVVCVRSYGLKMLLKCATSRKKKERAMITLHIYANINNKALKT